MPDNTIIEAIAAQVSAAAHGTKSVVIASVAEEYGVSVQTVQRWISPVRRRVEPRKQRRDAGASMLSDQDVLTLVAIHEETRRLTGSGTAPMEQIIDIAWANGAITGCLDPATGEATKPSASTVFRRARALGAHHIQLAQPTPAIELSSPHPNHCWQIDASVSTQFYFARAGAEVMDVMRFNHDKPGNLVKINDNRIWRYAITDHCSGAFELFYAQGAESALNLLSALIYAMTKRPKSTMYGVPHILMTDPGSAMTAYATGNFCAALGIELIINKPGNARAKGQVERTHKLIESRFETPLKLSPPVQTREEMQELADAFTWYSNAQEPLERNGTSAPRRERWLGIPPTELRLAPSIEQLRELANSKPKLCKVRDGRIQFLSSKYDVTGVPELCNGDKIEVLLNSFEGDASVRIIRTESDGRIVHLLAPRIEIDANGFSMQAAEIGTEYKRLPDTPADVARKAIELIRMDAATEEEAAAKRKAKYLPFGGRIDPLKHMREATVIPALPRAGTPAQVDAPQTIEAPPMALPVNPVREFPPVSQAEAAARLRPMVERRGGHWSAWCWQRVAERYPQGVPFDAFEAFADELAQATRLRVVDNTLPRAVGDGQ